MTIDKRALKEALLLTCFQLVFTLLVVVVFSFSSFFKAGLLAIPLSALAMALTERKSQLSAQWIKYLICGGMMLVLTWILYVIEERYMAGVLSHTLSHLIVAVWNFFPGVFKLVAAVLLIFLALAVCMLFFAFFLCLLLLANVVFTTWVLPRFNKLIE